MSEPLLRVWNLTKEFPLTGGLFGRHAGSVHAVDGVDFNVDRGETLGLVGESGCGKSTTGRCILRLLEPTAGEVRFQGRDILRLRSRELRRLREQMQIVFQDPFSSLNPRMTVEHALAEPLYVHRICPKADIPKRVASLLEMVGLRVKYAHHYPHE